MEYVDPKELGDVVTFCFSYFFTSSLWCLKSLLSLVSEALSSISLPCFNSLEQSSLPVNSTIFL